MSSIREHPQVITVMRTTRPKPKRDPDGFYTFHYHIRWAKERPLANLLLCAYAISKALFDGLPGVLSVQVTVHCYTVRCRDWPSRGHLSVAGREIARIVRLANHGRRFAFRRYKHDSRIYGSGQLFARISKEYYSRHRDTLIGDGRAVVYRRIDGQCVCVRGAEPRRVA